jgi:inner membrane protein
MITAHLPASYCLFRGAKIKAPYALVVALIAAVFPDLDLLLPLITGEYDFHHHHYWVHIPAFWAAVACVALPIAWRLKVLPTALVFLAGIFLHLCLDTIVGGIGWYYPFDDTLVYFIIIPATQPHWLLSFILHWTFTLELSIWALALVCWMRHWRTREISFA